MIKVILILVVLLLFGVCLFFYLHPRVIIVGDSMHPTLKNGEVYKSTRVFKKKKCVIGDIYIYTPPYQSDDIEFVIKRLIQIKDGKYFFAGDNLECSYDSWNYGYVDPKNVIAHINLEDRLK